MSTLVDFLLTLISAYVTGLLLNLTPCVYPLISVTVSLFRNQAKRAEAHPFINALTYVAGLAVFYGLLGLVSSLGVFFFGGYFQSPWVLTLLSILLFFLALSMFGLFTLQLPAWLVGFAQGPSKKIGHFSGLFLSGFLVAIFAAPCIGPPIVALMSLVAMKGDPFFAMGLFFVLALGLGTPYLVLGASSGMIERLPKSGIWLVWIERLFGVILIALSALYLILAWAPFLAPFWLPAALVAGGVYAGFLEKMAPGHPSLETIRKTLGVLAVVAGVVIFSLLFRERVKWEPYSAEKIAAAKSLGQPVVIDFYADWCLVCHELENLTFTHSQVVRALDPFVRLKVDMTDPDAAGSADVALKYGIFGVPTVIFLDPSGNEIKDARVEGFISPRELTAMIQSIVSGHAASDVAEPDPSLAHSKRV